MPEISPFFYHIRYGILPKIRYISEKYLDKPVRKISEFLFITTFIYFTLHFLISFFERLFGYQPVEFIDRLIHLNLFIEMIVKTSVFGFLITIYYLKYRKRVITIPKLNWIIILFIFSFFTVTGIKDIHHLQSRLKRADYTLTSIFSETAEGTIYDYFSGTKGSRLCHFFFKNTMRISGLYDLYMEKKIAFEGWRIRKKTRFFPYSCSVSKDAAIMIKNGFIRTPEELHYVTLVMEKEAGFDPKTTSKKETLRGLHAVAWVIKNRFHSKKFPQNIYDVVMQRRIRKSRVIWQFECIEKNPKLFIYHSRFHDHPLYQDGKMNTKSRSLAYKALVNVFIRGEKDPTSGAQFFYNPDLATVNIKSRRITRKINSHLFYR